jgi:hypothetical protein
VIVDVKNSAIILKKSRTSISNIQGQGEAQKCQKEAITSIEENEVEEEP